MAKWILVGFLILCVAGCFVVAIVTVDHDVRVIECSRSCDRRYTPDTQDWTDCCVECSNR